MHTSLAAFIAVRQAVLDLLAGDADPIFDHIEKKIGTDLSEKQWADVRASLATIHDETGDATTDAEIRDAYRLLRDHAYAAQEGEVDAK